MKDIELYADGACSGNPGPGGYGAILKYGNNEKELSQGYFKTTNNRMELMAIIAGLESLKKPCRVNIYSDSKYIVDSVNNGWARKWQVNGWRRNKKEMAKNPDLWERLLDLLEIHQTKFIWVKGHAGHLENERCDRLAVSAAKNPTMEDNYNL